MGKFLPSNRGTALRVSNDLVSQNDTLPASTEYISLKDNINRNASLPPAHNFSVKTGYAFILNRTKGIVGNDKKLEDGLSAGLTWDVQYQYFPKSQYGFGAIYSGYYASTTVAGQYYNTSLSYIAPLFCTKGKIDEKWMLSINMGIGYLGMRQNTVNNVTITAASVGTNIGIGAEYLLNKNWGIGLETSLLGGSFSKLTATNGYETKVVVLEKQRIGASRVNLAVGIHCYLP